MMTPDEYAEQWLQNSRLCGQPTKRGGKCNNPVMHYLNVACTVHTTEKTEQLRAILRAVERRAREEMQSRVEALTQQLSEAKKTTDHCKHYRLRDDLGRYLVVVGGYTYHSVEPVAVGDEVLMPRSEWYAPTWAPVAAIVSDYQGPTRSIEGHRVKENA